MAALLLALLALLLAELPAVAAALGRKKRGQGAAAVTLLSSAPRDSSCFTQGLLLHAPNGLLYESCGLYGESSLRVVRPHTWEVLSEYKFSPEIFAEGIAVLGDRLFVLTWTSRQMFVFGIDSHTATARGGSPLSLQLNLLGELPFNTFTGEGWGLTTDGTYLIASDGSNRLTYFFPPSADAFGAGQPAPPALQRVKQIAVSDAVTGRPVRDINELEFANGYIYANIWYKDVMAVIDADGLVVRWIDAAALYPQQTRARGSDCFNGIAYNTTDGSFVVTGKKWDRHFRVAID